jgi:predicted transposase/invertase (TIGR01784 family)
MDTDKLVYEIFAVDPGSFFEILGQPRSEAKHYVFRAVDLKAVERRVDGYFEPKDPSRPLYFSEILFYKKENAYANVFAKLFLRLEQVPTHPWRVAMLFESKSLEPEDVSAYEPLLNSGWVYRIYLDELQESSQSGFGLCMLKLASAPKSQAKDKTIDLAQRVKGEVEPERIRNKYLELIEFIASAKLTHLDKEEIRAMLNLGDYKKSRYYKEVREEAREEVREEIREEVREEAREEARQELIEKMAKHGFTPENIAQTMEMDLNAVKKILKKRIRK